VAEESDLEMEARRLIVTVEDRGSAKALVIRSDDLTVEILSEPGALTTAAGGYEELAREAGELAALLRRRAEPTVAPFVPEFSGERITS
jgi:hypothetical protein